MSCGLQVIHNELVLLRIIDCCETWLFESGHEIDQRLSFKVHLSSLNYNISFDADRREKSVDVWMILFSFVSSRTLLLENCIEPFLPF